MFAFSASNVHRAIHNGITWLLDQGIEEPSRNGPVLVAPSPVCTTYECPEQHIVMSAHRDANPFFHFFEALWMLAGDNDIEFPCYFAKTYAQYSDDGETMWDAYGYRWRHFFGWDQMDAIASELIKNPSSRRCVLAMWNAMPVQMDHPLDEPQGSDHHVASRGGKAVPCNTQAYFDTIGGKGLNMTVTCRSNDTILGCYGSNVVHFSMLLEYMALRTGMKVGEYRQFSNNFHAYLNVHSRDWLYKLTQDVKPYIPIVYERVLMDEEFLSELAPFMAWMRRWIVGKPEVTDEFQSQYILKLAQPLFQAWYWRKRGDIAMCLAAIANVEDAAWRQAAEEWVLRRVK